MITGLNEQIQFKNWQEELKNGFDDSNSLLTFLGLDKKILCLNNQRFPLRVPLSFARRMQHGDPHDPLLKQVMVTADEQLQIAGYSHEPLVESAHSPLKGLLHKYAGRVLLVLTGGCAINCRYCFRRHFPYDEHQIKPDDWQAILSYIQEDTSITEVILSGGDPLMLPDKPFTEKLNQIAKIAHVKRLRIHTRIPIVLPTRITQTLLKALEALRLQTVVVVHVNHPNEIDKGVSDSMRLLRQAGVTLLNQSVLLKAINDDVDTLAELSTRLFESGILPYYLHLLDKVSGAHHFDVPKSTAVALFAALQTRLPGYLVPRLAEEIPHLASKQLIGFS